MKIGEEWQPGWRVVLAGSIGMGTGVGLYTMLAGLFIRPLEAEFGWARGDIAAAGVFGVLASFLLPAVGVLADRFGVRVVAATGMVLLASGYVALSQLTDQLWHYYLTLSFFLLTGMVTGPLVFTKAVNTWFIRSRGLALGFTLSGVTVTAMIFLPVAAIVIDHWGWRAALLLLAALPVGLGLPAVLAWLREKPSDSGVITPSAESDAPSLTLGDALRERRFWLLSGGLFCANLAVGGLLSQLQPILFEQGFSTVDASLLGSFFAAAIALGRLGCGWLLDRFWAPGVASSCLLFPIIGLTVLLAAPEPVFYLGILVVLCLGLAQGAEVDFVAFLIPRYFGMENYGSLFGCFAMLISISLALGGILFGYVYDSYLSYRPALTGAIYCYAVGALGVLLSGLQDKFSVSPNPSG